MKMYGRIGLIAVLVMVILFCGACELSPEVLEVPEPLEPVVVVPEKAEEQIIEETDKEEPSQEPMPTTNENGFVVVLDPGHQRHGDSALEANGPGSDTKKARVTGGTTGVSTGVPEYKLNLQIAKKVKAELESRGYTVYMTRTSHDVNISNKERAQFASSKGADIAVRIHANGASDRSVRGALMLAPSTSNPYISYLAKDSQRLSSCILDAYCKATGFRNRGVQGNDTMTGINWSEVPVTIIEMGFMSNATEDEAMQKSSMQEKMAQGIANGIDDYFGR